MRERDFQYMVIGHVCNLARHLWFGAARRALSLPRELIFRVANVEPLIILMKLEILRYALHTA